MSMFNTINLAGLGLLPIKEGDVVEVTVQQGSFYGRLKRVGNASLTMTNIQSDCEDKILSNRNLVTFDLDDIVSILQY